MASIFNALLAPGWADAVRRVFGIKSGPGINVVSPEVQISLNPLEIQSMLALMGAFPWSVTRSAIAVVGQNSGITARNPAGSGLIVTLLGFSSQQVNNVLSLRTFNTSNGVTSSGNISYLDGRLYGSGGSGACPLVTDTLASAALANLVFVLDQFVANAITPYQATLAPGHSVVLSGNAVNTAVGGNFFGIARRATTEELTLGS